MISFRVFLATMLALVTVGCSSDSLPSTVPPGDAISGVVVDADTEAPVAGATVTAEPDGRSAVTGADGRFAFGFEAPRPSTVTLTVERVDYSRVRMHVPPAWHRDLEVALPPFDRIEASSHGFRVWAQVVDGGLDHPTITWSVEVENHEMAPLGPVAIVGRLDFPAGLTEESFDLRAAAPGEVELEIGDDGRSFTVRLDALAATSGLVEVLRLTVASPGPDSTICHFVEGEADGDGATLRYDDSSCLTTPVSG